MSGISGPRESSSSDSNEPIEFNDLPDEIRTLVLANLSNIELSRVGSVSKDWNASVLEINKERFRVSAKEVISAFPKKSQEYLEAKLKEALKATSFAKGNEIMGRAFVKAAIDLDRPSLVNAMRTIDDGSSFKTCLALIPKIRQLNYVLPDIKILKIFPFDIPQYVLEEIDNISECPLQVLALKIFDHIMKGNIKSLLDIQNSDYRFYSEQLLKPLYLLFLMEGKKDEARVILQKYAESHPYEKGINKYINELLENLDSDSETLRIPEVNFAIYWSKGEYKKAGSFLIKQLSSGLAPRQLLQCSRYIKTLCQEKLFSEAFEFCMNKSVKKRWFFRDRDLAILAISISLSPPSNGKELIDKILPELKGTRYESIVKPHVEARWP